MTHQEDRARAHRASDRALWRECREADAPEDAAARLLDLAAFADGRLDPDDSERVAALIAGDSSAAADIAAARAPAGAAPTSAIVLDRIVERAVRLVQAPSVRRVLPFRSASPRRLATGVAQWASLAAALVLASWLGFAMGSDFSLAYGQAAQSVSSDDGSLPEMLDPSTAFLGDFAEDMHT